MIAMSCDRGLNILLFFFFFQAEDGIRDDLVTGVQTCALPISEPSTGLPTIEKNIARMPTLFDPAAQARGADIPRSEDHTSELQSPDHLVCRLLLEKKKASRLYLSQGLQPCLGLPEIGWQRVSG